MIDFLIKHKEKLNWREVSKRVPFHLYFAHSELPWDVDGLFQNQEITLDFIRQFPIWITPGIRWSYLSANPAISIESMLATPTLPWDFAAMSCHPNLRVYHVLANLDRGWYWPKLCRFTELLQAFPHLMDWSIASCEVNLAEIDDKFPYYPWNAMLLSTNPTLTIEFVRRYKHLGIFNWTILSANPALDPTKHRDLPWDWTAASWNTNVRRKFVKKHRYRWNYDGLCAHVRFSIRIRRKITDWYRYSINPGVTPSIVKKHPEIPWDFNGLVSNKSIPLSFIDEMLTWPRFAKNQNWDLISARV